MHKPAPFNTGQPLLHLGDACVNAEPLTREFYLKNNGSCSAKVAWGISSATCKSNGPVKFEATVVDGKVKSSILFWEDVNR